MIPENEGLLMRWRKECLCFKQRYYVLIFFFIVFLTYSFPNYAYAGLWGDIKNGYHTITELPGKVNDLQEDYQETKDKLLETQKMAEDLQKQNEKLLADNARQSQELSKALISLQAVEKRKIDRNQKIRATFYTGAILLVGYFCSTRILRLILRRKSFDKSKD